MCFVSTEIHCYLSVYIYTLNLKNDYVYPYNLKISLKKTRVSDRYKLPKILKTGNSKAKIPDPFDVNVHG